MIKKYINQALFLILIFLSFKSINGMSKSYPTQIDSTIMLKNTLSNITTLFEEYKEFFEINEQIENIYNESIEWAKLNNFNEIFFNIINNNNSIFDLTNNETFELLFRIAIYLKHKMMVNFLFCNSKMNYKFKDEKTPFEFVSGLGKAYQNFANFMNDKGKKIQYICHNNLTKKINTAIAEHIEPLLIRDISNIIAQYTGFSEENRKICKLSDNEINEIITVNKLFFGDQEEEKEKSEQTKI